MSFEFAGAPGPEWIRREPSTELAAAYADMERAERDLDDARRRRSEARDRIERLRPKLVKREDTP